MKQILIILTLLCVACVGCTLSDPIIVTSVNMRDPSATTKYLVSLNNGTTYLYTDSLYSVGDTIK